MRIDSRLKYGIPTLTVLVACSLAMIASRLPFGSEIALWLIALLAPVVPLVGFFAVARIACPSGNLRRFIARFEEVPIPLLVVDSRYRVVVANRPFRELVGLPREALHRKNVLSALPAEWAEIFLAQYELFRSGAAHAQSEPAWLPRRGGSPVFLRFRSMTMSGKDAHWTVSFCEDLSQSQRIAEEQTLWSERVQDFVQRLIDVIPMPVYLKDTESRLIMVNDAFANARDMAKESLLGKTPFHLARTLEHAQLTVSEDREVLRGASVMKEERSLDFKSDSPRYRLVTKGCCLDAAGNPVIVGANFDVTRWRNAEEALTVALERETERRERTQQYVQRLINVIPQPVYVKDDQGRLVMFNDAFTQEWNLPREQLLGHTAFELAPGNPRSQIALEEDRAVLAGMAVHKEECSAHWSTGEERYRIVTKGSCLNDEGEHVIVCATFDITELRQAERSLQSALNVQSRTRAFLQTMFDALPNPVVVTDTDLHYIMTNQAWRATFSLHPEDIGWRDSAPERFSDMMKQPDGTVRELEVSVPRDSCHVSHFIVRGTATTDLDGNRVLLCVYSDITTIKEAEEASVRARQAAERANEAKSLFVANMSHEVRTPMHAVLSFAHLGQEKSAGDERLKRYHGYFERIVRSGERLMTMLDSVLDLSKLEAGRQEARRTPLALRPLVDEVVVEFSVLLAARKQVIVVFGNDRSQVLGDENLLSRVVRNLVSNAAKFSPEGRTIDIHLGQVGEGDKARVELIVADRGVGIPESELDCIFNKFVQSSSTSTGAGGTGLGLAICREIVHLHEGEIFARNRPGGGAEFVVHLPPLKEKVEGKAEV